MKRAKKPLWHLLWLAWGFIIVGLLLGTIMSARLQSVDHASESNTTLISNTISEIKVEPSLEIYLGDNKSPLVALRNQNIDIERIRALQVGDTIIVRVLTNEKEYLEKEGYFVVMTFLQVNDDVLISLAQYNETAKEIRTFELLSKGLPALALIILAVVLFVLVFVIRKRKGSIDSEFLKQGKDYFIGTAPTLKIVIILWSVLAIFWTSLLILVLCIDKYATRFDEIGVKVFMSLAWVAVIVGAVIHGNKTRKKDMLVKGLETSGTKATATITRFFTHAKLKEKFKKDQAIMYAFEFQVGSQTYKTDHVFHHMAKPWGTTLKQPRTTELTFDETNNCYYFDVGSKEVPIILGNDNKIVFLDVISKPIKPVVQAVDNGR